jgi:hypothetical protein
MNNSVMAPKAFSGGEINVFEREMKKVGRSKEDQVRECEQLSD